VKRLRAAYGASPLHLLAALASFALAAYAILRITEGRTPVGTLIWLGAAVVAHDLIAFPLYSALNLVAGRALRAPGQGRTGRLPVAPLNHVRIPFVLSAIALLMFFPMILGLDEPRYEASTGRSVDVFLGRWLLVCAALFAGSALLYAIRLRRAARPHDPQASPAFCHPEGDKRQGSGESGGSAGSAGPGEGV
jgi:hypothetical protein